MRRILHLAKYYPPYAGGIEYFVRDLAHAQACQGNRVSVVAHGAASRDGNDGPVTLFEAKAYGQLLYAPLSPNYLRVLSRAIATLQPDLLHFHLPNPSVFWCLASKPARALPWVIHWHSDVVADRPGRLLTVAYQGYKPLEKQTLRRAGAIIASTDSYRDHSRPLTVWRDKTRIIPLGIDPERLQGERQPAGQFNVGAGQLTVLMVGRLSHYKGHHVLLEALSHCQDVSAIIVGQGEREQKLRARVKQLGLNQRVTFTGTLEQPEVNWLMAHCDVLCLPSTVRSESFGLVLVEAMAAGLPVITSDLPGSGMPWIVRTAGNGLLVDPGDPVSLARAFEQMRDPALRQQFAESGLATFQKHFHIDRIAEQVNDLYGHCEVA